jgi:hypothetical protein
MISYREMEKIDKSKKILTNITRTDRQAANLQTNNQREKKDRPTKHTKTDRQTNRHTNDKSKNITSIERTEKQTNKQTDS